MADFAVSELFSNAFHTTSGPFSRIGSFQISKYFRRVHVVELKIIEGQFVLNDG